MALRTIKVWGNNLDLPNAKKWFVKYLTGHYNFTYISTVGYTKAQKAKAAISASDIIVGGIQAGVGKGFTVPAGTLRLWGQLVRDTDIEIEKWAKHEHDRLHAEIDRLAADAAQKAKDDAAKLAAEIEAARPKNPPTAPAMPVAPASFDLPTPTFSDDLEIVKKVSYFFGLDKVKVSKKEINENSCFVSKDVSIGQLQEGEYIQIEAQYGTGESSSVEFYIIDGGTEEPILPIGDNMVSREKVFYGLRSRFAMDLTKEVVVQKNGATTGISFDQAMKLNDGLYTVSYTPLNPHSYRPISTTIKVKIIERIYDKTAAAPYVRKVQIRKYGGNALWKEDTLVN